MQRLTLFFNFRVELGLHFWVIHFTHELHFVHSEAHCPQSFTDADAENGNFSIFIRLMVVIITKTCLHRL